MAVILRNAYNLYHKVFYELAGKLKLFKKNNLRHACIIRNSTVNDISNEHCSVYL